MFVSRLAHKSRGDYPKWTGVVDRERPVLSVHGGGMPS